MLKKDNEIVEELDKSFEEALRDIKAIHFSSNIVDIKAMSVSVLRVLSASLKMAKHDNNYDCLAKLAYFSVENIALPILNGSVKKINSIDDSEDVTFH